MPYRIITTWLILLQLDLTNGISSQKELIPSVHSLGLAIYVNGSWINHFLTSSYMKDIFGLEKVSTIRYTERGSFTHFSLT